MSASHFMKRKGQIVVKKNLSLSLVISSIGLTGCTTSKTTNNKPASSQDSITEESKDDVKVEIVLNDDKEETEETNNADGNGVLYDRTFLEKKNDGYIYRLTDKDLIEKYNELYRQAFIDVAYSLNEITIWQNESYTKDKPIKINNLVYDNNKNSNFVDVGSNFEMDYGFDLENIGYTYVDLDSDGVYELLFGVLKPKYSGIFEDNCFERAYALVNNTPTKFLETGVRGLYYLGKDGCVYSTGSSGAAYGGTRRMHFDISHLKEGEDVDWGSIALVSDEFVGVWNETVHINPVTDIDEQAKMSEYQVSGEEANSLEEEFKSRKVEIEWLKFWDVYKNINLEE